MFIFIFILLGYLIAEIIANNGKHSHTLSKVIAQYAHGPTNTRE